MKRNLAIFSASLAIAAAASLGVTNSSNAQDLRSSFSRQTLPSAAQEDTAQGGAETPISPDAKAGNLPGQYGIVRSVSSDAIEVRMLDGTTKQMPVTGEMMNYASGLQRGSVVGFDTDPASGNLTKLEAAQVDRTVSGTVSSIEGDQVTVQSSSGESITTPLSSATVARMGLAPGKELIVTTYKDTWATKVCCPETPAPVNTVVPTPAPQPAGAPFVPPPPKPVPGLW
jgi:molybdopterin-binding protein